MVTFNIGKSDYVTKPIDGVNVSILLQEKYDSFDLSLLGLGDINQKSVSIDAIAAIFDLEGFTKFCTQIDPRLSVPLFLSEFLTWLLNKIKEEMTIAPYKGVGVSLYCPLPFLVKFMGDGLLVLWDISDVNDTEMRNIIVSASEICEHYPIDFLPSIRKKVVEPPAVLRCGMARGTVYSVGNKNDFVGPCINLAARLQKVPGTTFAFNQRGFNLEAPNANEFFKNDIVIKKMAIRGIGEGEIVGILKREYEAMNSENMMLFQDP